MCDILPSRREFTQSVLAGGAVATLLGGKQTIAAPAATVATEPLGNHSRILKSVKWGMIQTNGTVADKFALMKSLGYDGMELESPIGLDPVEVRKASEATGMPVHGAVNMRHWNVRLSDPAPQTRAQSQQILQQCLEETHAFGGYAVLLVPGAVRGDDENHDQVWQRSIAEIRKTLPTASRLGVRILIENVWNGFCESPDEFCDYLDAIASPWVGAYFDVGNARKFAPSEEWIRKLGARIVKLDIKDWSEAKGFCRIGEGDVNWPAVRQALAEINYTGWATAEVEGGAADQLRDIAQRMDHVLELSG